MPPPEPLTRPPRFAHAVAVLFGAHAAGLLVPLLTVPWLARTAAAVQRARFMLTPLTQAFFPRISILAKESPVLALREIRRTLAVLVGLALCGALVTALFGHTVVSVLLGPLYASSVPVLRLLVLVMPLVAALLVPRHGAMGMAIAVVSAKSCVTALLAVAFLRSRR